MQSNVTKRLKEHYQRKFIEFGATAKGVDWGKEDDVLLRHKLMLSLIESDNVWTNDKAVSLLDVGCGYGAFYKYISQTNFNISYSGIDVVEDMIEYANRHYSQGTFIHGDFMEASTSNFDYVICNGILTQKLTTSIIEMDIFANGLIRKMFATANRGISFNIMTTKVNFMADNLYYRHPLDTLAFCLSELSSKVRIDHSYNLFEYTVHVYKD